MSPVQAAANRLPYTFLMLTWRLPVATAVSSETAAVPPQHLGQAEAVRMAATWSSSRGSNQMPTP
ncbi:hypothetical protein FDG2_5165 [Candidatus Protofrankia californiensis]|uniref:Uncharacterized protein n=1 Tax=Candidatus Protofrankia californiensis TaxID=1839754 RepID=A0A1C3PBD5_9ACTN|nr:hypothetical protein FDG2_5165 [Candidatus Protofrankia californiensis]